MSTLSKEAGLTIMTTLRCVQWDMRCAMWDMGYGLVGYEGGVAYLHASRKKLR